MLQCSDALSIKPALEERDIECENFSYLKRTEPGNLVSVEDEVFVRPTLSKILEAGELVAIEIEQFPSIIASILSYSNMFMQGLSFRYFGASGRKYSKLLWHRTIRNSKKV